jgi:hypothetical protein
MLKRRIDYIKQVTKDVGANETTVYQDLAKK